MMSNPRIAHVHWTARPVSGGVETHIDALARQLSEHGVAVSVLAGTRDGACRYVPYLDLAHEATPDEGAALATTLGAYDLVVLHNPQWHRPERSRLLVDALQRRHRATQIVADVHNVDDDAGRWKALRDLALPVVAHSSYVREQVERAAPELDARVLPLALPPRGGGYAYPDSDAPTKVLQPTRLTVWKGSHLSLEAACALLDEGRTDFTFHHAGTQQLLWPPGISDELWARVNRWRDAGRMHLTHYPPEQSWSAIEQADVVLHPTTGVGGHGEPFSMSVAQAIICGRPIIGSDSGNLPRLLAHYSLGRVLPAGDGAALTAALREALEAPAPAPKSSDADLARALQAESDGAWAAYLALADARPVAAATRNDLG